MSDPINVEATLRKYLAEGDIAGEDEDLLASIFTDAANAIAGLRNQLEKAKDALEMRRTARELRATSNGNCNAVEQAAMWDRKADAQEAALTDDHGAEK